ncbi:MAG: hypothetical protein JXA92_04725 [candidate division Zixibacteria bacterium]|nr:hypothetical protein [candidate division Zixibacteria bacterium]
MTLLDQGGIIRVTLCPSCVNAGTCVNRAIRGYDILFCDMFEDSGYMNMNDENKSLGKRQVSRSNREQNGKETTAALKGLCQNCVQRDTCALPRPKTGVWHCEEFEEIP